MKKLSLDLDHLAVESFATGAEDGVRGTIRGNSSTLCNPSGVGCSEFYSCVQTCGICDGHESHRATCGAGTRCGGDSIDACQSDWCPVD